jgi:hypothetical protein
MYQRSKRNIFALRFAIAVLAAMPCVQVAHADDLLDYLETQGLDSLAALRVEELAASAKSPEDRVQYLDQLAELFARLLDASDTSVSRERLLARADQLTAELSTARGDLLRVAAARTRYREAAKVAESIRAGAADAAMGEAASATLAAQAQLLLDVGKRAEKRAGELEKKVDARSGLERDVLLADIDAERSLAGQSRYLAAWCHLYEGFLTKDRKPTETANRTFMDLLGARDGRLEPSEISEDLRSDEAYANAILGLALARARLSGLSEGLRWLDLLDAQDVFPATREALPGWRMVAALEAKAFDAALKALTALSDRPDAANWARVAAARAIVDGLAGSGASDRDTANDADALLRAAIASLAARRDLRTVRELVTRYGESILGPDASGFVPRYVRAVALYEEAQDVQRALDASQEGGAATTETQKLEELRGRSAMAAEALGAALTAEDAGRFEDARAACQLMRAWSLRGAGQQQEAAKAFDAFAEKSLGARAEDAARAAIACVDDVRREAKDAATRTAAEQELIARVEAFLARFPGSEHVPELLVRKIAASSEPQIEDVDRLLLVKPGTPEWLPSRTQALSALYRAFRGGRAPRSETGKRYTLVLAELPRDPKTQLPASNPSIARQALEVVLSSEIRELRVAQQLIAALDAAGQAGQFDLREADEELAYRRLQLAILADRWADAEAALAPFEKPEATGIWADAALRLALRGAETRRRNSKPDSPERAGFVSTIVRAGDAILLRAGGVDKALASDAPDLRASSQIARVAIDARVELVESSQDAEEAKRGVVMTEALLRDAPRDAALLTAAAKLCEVAGDDERAAAHLRALVGGLPARSNPWFEAKIAQMRVLARLDPVRARAVIDQFRTLYPDLGPEPYRSRIAAFDASVPKSSAGESLKSSPSTAPSGEEGGA